MNDARAPCGRAGQGVRPPPRRRTIRVRLALVFFAVFLASGAVLLAVTVVVWQKQLGGVAIQATALPAQPDRTETGIAQRGSDRHQLLVAAGSPWRSWPALSLAIGWLVAGRFLGPLRTITAATREISASNLHERLHLAGPDDELKELADTVDQLLGRLERSFAFERQFVANASHELRTPLAAMRTSLDVAMAKPEPVPAHIATLADRLRRELDQIDRLLESFLALARAQQGPADDRSTVSLAELAAHGDRAPRRRDRNDAGSCRAATGSAGAGQRQRHAARANGRERDRQRDRPQPAWRLDPCQHGIGRWARAARPSRTAARGSTRARSRCSAQPFRRIGAERTGSDRGAGLGLAIVASIVEVHGGTLELEARDDGGLRVAIDLPARGRRGVGAPT